jgi:hypothetical protein
MFNGNSFVGSDACAYDRNAMLNGQPAKQVCFQQNSSVGGLLPADVDGTTPPPAGSPNFLLFFGNNNVNLFKFHVDFTTPANSKFTGPTVIPVAAFSPLCGGGTCVPQSGTTQQLDSLADRLMYRLAYRNFGDHESLVVNHSVTAGSGGGVRWYEIQNPNGAPVLAQQGTFAPDSSFRWMGSIAMDHAGDIAVGYSVSSSSMHPSIAFTGRIPSDPPGTLEAETNIITGGGSQVGGNPPLTRWGDYSAMTVDPVDDCTFWYTDEYLKTTGAFNWNTRIANFKFPNCGNAADFSLSASGSPQTVVAGNSASYTATVSPINGFTGSVTLSVSGLPSGAAANFSVNPITNGSGSSTLTVSTSASTPPGTYTVTINGAGPSTSHMTTVTLVVTGFTLAVSPTSSSVVVGASTSYTATVTPQGTFSGTVSVSITGLPSGATATSCSITVPPAGSCTLSVSTSATTPIGSFTLTVTATGGGLTHTQTVTLNVTAQPVPDFTVASTPSASVTQGGSTTYTVSVGALNGFAGTVMLAVNGLPTGATGTFNPSSILASGTSILTVSTAANTPTGTFTNVTIVGTGAGIMHSATVSLTVNAATGLPPGWTDGDIGAPGIAGSATFSNGTFTVKGGGADIWSTSDHFNYASESIAGNVTITARVASQQNTNAWAKSGVMIRASRAANSAFVHVFVTPGHGVNMQVRRSTGASASQVAQVAGRVAPQWVRIVRSGNTFTGFTSTDGVTFTRVGQVTLTMTTNALEGLSVCAHNNAALNTSTFDNVTIQ